MTTGNPRAFSDLPIPPGEVLAEELEARGITHQQLAAKLGIPVQLIGGIIRGNRAISPDIAFGLSKVLGIEASFWVNLETEYQAVSVTEHHGNGGSATEVVGS